VTNSISSDNFSTPRPAKQRNFDAPESGQAAATGSDPSAATPQDAADLQRAQQRLAHESGEVRTVAIGSLQQAREQVEQLRSRLHRDPQSALQAHQRIDDSVFEAAMARPTI
jgi:hypothetical protein